MTMIAFTTMITKPGVVQEAGAVGTGESDLSATTETGEAGAAVNDHTTDVCPQECNHSEIAAYAFVYLAGFFGIPPHILLTPIFIRICVLEIKAQFNN